MSDYCNCCSTNVEHIRQHYDPSGLTMPWESPDFLLAFFRGMDRTCPLTLRDIENYLAAVAAEQK